MCYYFICSVYEAAGAVGGMCPLCWLQSSISYGIGRISNLSNPRRSLARCQHRLRRISFENLFMARVNQSASTWKIFFFSKKKRQRKKKRIDVCLVSLQQHLWATKHSSKRQSEATLPASIQTLVSQGWSIAFVLGWLLWKFSFLDPVKWKHSSNIGYSTRDDFCHRGHFHTINWIMACFKSAVTHQEWSLVCKDNPVTKTTLTTWYPLNVVGSRMSNI